MHKPVAIGLCAIVFAFAVSIASRPGRGGETAFVGLHVQGMAPALAEALGLKRPHGVLVRDVALGGPAAAAGFRRGDLILRIDGQELDTFDRLIAIMGRLAPGDRIPVTVRRGAAEVALTLLAGPWPEAWRIDRGSFATLPEVGLTLAALTPKVRERFAVRWGSTGVIVTLIDPAKATGTDMGRGELVVQVNQQTVWDPQQVLDAYQRAKTDGRRSLLVLVEGANGFRFTLIPVR